MNSTICPQVTCQFQVNQKKERDEIAYTCHLKKRADNYHDSWIYYYSPHDKINAFNQTE